MGAVAILVMLILNAVFFYSGMMLIPLNVNSNSIIMLNYQYIFYAIGAYSALNWRDIAETSTYEKRNAASVVLLALVIVYFSYIMKHGNVVINHFF